MIAKTIAHYRILEKLGEGGMGVVYKAHDAKLDRKVALKFLPPNLTTTEEVKQRFIREAKAVAALNHPHICTIYSVEEQDGLQFISMECIEGVTLREKLDTRNQKSETPATDDRQLTTIINYAIQIAEALEEAHSKGIIHRDIKPENIMVDSKNRIKVMDFGLAKFKGSVNLTKAGSTVGTAAYMSPEQIQGGEVDHRSDIFSFGVVLYEMLVGNTPFHGEHEAAMMYLIVNEDPLPVSYSVPGISSLHENLIGRTLEKDPSDRYQSMEDLLSDLRRLKRKTSNRIAIPIRTASTPSSAPEQHSAYAQKRSVLRFPVGYIASAVVAGIIVVAAYAVFFIPGKTNTPLMNPDRIFVAVFENRTGDSSLDPIGKLMSDWIINGIMNNEIAEVIPTLTMLQMIQQAGLVGGGLQDRTKLIELAEATNSGILVSGMFHHVGDDIQFHAQIIDAQRNDVIITLEPVRGPRSEPMKAINDLQQKIMGALAMHVYPGSDIRMISDPPIYEAYIEFIEGTKYFGLDYDRAFSHYLRAIEIDPEFIGPKLRIATGYGNLGEYAKADSILQTIDHERDRLSSYERYYIDWYRFSLLGRDEEAFAVLLHIESIVPLDVVTNYLVGLYAYRLNRPGITVETYEKMIFQDYWAEFPTMSWRFGVLSSAHHLLGNYQKELEVTREAQQYYPNDLALCADECSALAALGKVEEMYNVIEGIKHIEPTAGSVGYVMLTASRELRAHGNKTEALLIAEQAVQWFNEHDPVNRPGLADALYLAERWDEAYKLYEELSAENPENIFCQGRIGTLAARKGNDGEARRIAGELRDTDQKYLFGMHTYLRARIHTLLGEHIEAVQLIQESFKQGRHFGVYIHHDIDLELLRDYPSFKKLLEPKG